MWVKLDLYERRAQNPRENQKVQIEKEEVQWGLQVVQEHVLHALDWQVLWENEKHKHAQNYLDVQQIFFHWWSNSLHVGKNCLEATLGTWAREVGLR